MRLTAESYHAKPHGSPAGSPPVSPEIAVVTVTLDPAGILGWILVGLVSGALAARVVHWHRLGCVATMFVGLAGAFVGGFLFSLVGYNGTFGTFGSMVVAFIGAVIMLSITEFLSGGRARGR